MKTLIAFAMVLIATPVAGQDYIVKPNETERQAIAQLNDEQRIVVQAVLMGEPLKTLTAVSDVGEVGLLPGYKTESVGSGRVREDRFSSGGGSTRTRWALDVSQIIDEDTALAMGYTLWLDGWPTTGLADGQGWPELKEEVAVRRESKQYESAIGQRTVMCFERVDAQPAIDLATEILAREKWRMFTGKDGRQQIAKYVRRNATFATLRLPDGETIRVKLDALTPDDVLWIKDQ